MGTRQKHIFTRTVRASPRLDIYSRTDTSGNQVEVREDAEQQVKYHEIVEALVAAGYYRAQLQGLSAFDKIVGGMTWCIEICDIDVDVNLLFEENLTIGKKIALTEKIVGVLPSMQCPYIIEPHQIQGLDFINIYPLILWLIKHSDEFREVKEDELRRFAVAQYDKDNIFQSDRARISRERQMLKNLAIIQNLYKPCRVRKRKGAMPKTELEQVNATLSEYDHRMLLQSSQDDPNSQDDGLEFLRDYEKTLVDPSKITIAAEQYSIDQVDDQSDRNLHYAILQSELSGEVSQVLQESEKAKYLEDVSKLKNQLETLESELVKVKESYEGDVEGRKKELLGKKEVLQRLKELVIGQNSRSMSDRDVKDIHSTLKGLSKERNEMKLIIEHKDKEFSELEKVLSALKDPSVKRQEEPLTASELQQLEERESKLQQYTSELRAELAKVNREVLGLSRACDDVPGQAELLQYERRFIELYDQVAAKHKETKQFYTFYNTLYEVKLYTSKELSLLNSILENYEEAMSSAKKREQFMTQLETIVEWVKTAVVKVERKYAEEREKKARLNSEYADLLEVQRQYTATLKRLAGERRKLRQVIR